MQSNQIELEEAVAQSSGHCDDLLTLAQRHRQQHTAIGQCKTIRHWQSDAGTYCYQTHIAIPGQSVERLLWLANIFYNGASLSQYPWYPQFEGGATDKLDAAPPTGIAQHQLCWGRIDLGLSAPRYYRQLISLALSNENSAVIAARSVRQGPALPSDALLAYTVAPNGEVLYVEDGCLHWHHICCTTGAVLLPGRWDRWLINGLRLLRLDQAERRTYQQEAEQLSEWLQQPDPTVEYAADVPVASSPGNQ